MPATEDSILEFIPQRPPMVMIGSIVESDAAHTVTEFTVSGSNVFFDRGRLSESGLVENIAQTAAAGVGYACKASGTPVPVGFIAAVKDLQVHGLPSAGDTIRTEVTVKNQVLDVTIIEGSVELNGTILAKCEMRIFLKNN